MPALTEEDSNPLRLPAVYPIVGLLLLSAFTMRPSLMGEMFTPVSMVFAAAALALVLSTIGRGVQVERAIIWRNFLIAASVALLWAYLSLHSVFQDARQPVSLVKALVSIPFLVLVFAVALSWRSVNRIFFVSLVWVFVLSVISYIVTLILAFIVPLDGLFLFQLQSTFYEGQWGGFYFPFTAAYGIIRFSGFEYFRNLGPFREAGIFQAFLIWAYFVLPYLGMERRWIKVVLFAGILTTLSTSGIAVFFATLALKNVFMHDGELRLKKYVTSLLFTLIVFAVGAVTIVYLPVFGLIDKMEKAQASISDRMEGTVTGLSGFLDNPIGIGMYNATDPNVGINLLSALWMIGVIGLLIILVLAVVSTATVRAGAERRAFIITIFPFAVTGVLTQPFIESPLVFIMLLQILSIHQHGLEDKGRVSNESP